MQVRLLGPMEIEIAGNAVQLPRRRARCLLGILLLNPNRVVPTARLAELLWDGDPPARARQSIHSHVSHARTALAAAGGQQAITLAFKGNGYTAALDPQLIDVHRFRSQLDEATGNPDHAERAAQLRAALDLWRGPVLENAASDWLRNQICSDLTEQRLTAVEEFMSVSLRLRRERQVLPELARIVAAHPQRETLVELHMRALYQASRKLDALHVYDQTRRRLADEYGLDPGQELRELHQAILRDELVAPSQASEPAAEPAAAATAVPPPVVVPRQLPAPPQLFTGRADELAELDKSRCRSTVVITSIDGMAGVGKTALALHAAHRIADQYPDGQLFMDLHGYTPGVPPVEPADALERLLRALGVAGEQIPGDPDERAALYRSRLAGQQLLIVLDNAATEAQVAPLLPGTLGCLVLITSRRRLTGLDATDALSLDTLPLPDALTLLVRTVGEERLAAEPQPVLGELVQACGRLPLAIRIAAARLRSHPAWTAGRLLQRLRDHQHRLAELASGQRSVTAALEVSYQQLATDQQRLYRLLGLHPGPDIDGYAAAALADLPHPQTVRLLDQLLDAHLLQEPTPGQYAFHDLVGAHAAQTALAADAEPDRRTALTRLFHHYRHTASVAMDLAYPYERERRPRVPPAPTSTPDMSSPGQAIGWLDTELPNLLAAARNAADNGWPAYALDLSSILGRHLDLRGRHHDAETLHGRALTIARATGHQTGQATALTGLGWVHLRQGRDEQAADGFGQALQIARTIGNRASELDALTGLGHLHRLRGRHKQAADRFGQALQIAGTIGNRASELAALNGLGFVELLQGRHEKAADGYRRALQIARMVDNRVEELDALTGLGELHRLQGRYEQATGYYSQVIQLARTIGNRASELNALIGLGWAELQQHRHETATGYFRQLLDLGHETGIRNAQFEAVHGLGRLHLASGDPEAALAHHHEALELATDLAQPGDQARAHDGLAHAHHTQQRPDLAKRHWQRALDLLVEMGVDRTENEEADTSTIRANLAKLDQQPN